MIRWRGPLTLLGIVLVCCSTVAVLTYTAQRAREETPIPTTQAAPPPSAVTAVATILSGTSVSPVSSVSSAPSASACAAPTSPPGSVAGVHAASPDSPAGGGLYAGASDTQIAQTFQAQDGPNWQADWAQEHNKAVSCA